MLCCNCVVIRKRCLLVSNYVLMIYESKTRRPTHSRRIDGLHCRLANSALLCVFLPLLYLSALSFWPPRCSVSLDEPSLSAASTLEHISTPPGDQPSKCPRPRTLQRQQSLQQPLQQHRPTHHQPATSQSLGQLQFQQQSTSGSRSPYRAQQRAGCTAGTRSRTAGGRSRSNPGSWDYVMGQLRNRGLDMKSFL